MVVDLEMTTTAQSACYIVKIDYTKYKRNINS